MKEDIKGRQEEQIIAPAMSFYDFIEAKDKKKKKKCCKKYQKKSKHCKSCPLMC